MQSTAPDMSSSPQVPVAPAAQVPSPLIPPRPVAGMADNRPPIYPESARRRQQQGRVIVRVAVSADGAPVNASVAQSSGYSLLDEAAVAAVRQWRFIPASQGGKPTAATAEVPVSFRLQE